LCSLSADRHAWLLRASKYCVSEDEDTSKGGKGGKDHETLKVLMFLRLRGILLLERSSNYWLIAFIATWLYKIFFPGARFRKAIIKG